MAAAYRTGEPGAPKRAKPTGSLTSAEDVVMQAVKIGYQIADEQILKGQDFARRLRGAAVRSDLGELGDLVDHGLRLARQMAILFLEFAETSTQPQAILKAMRRAAEDGVRAKAEVSESEAAEPSSLDSTLPEVARNAMGVAGRAGKEDTAPQHVPVIVRSERPTSVSVHLFKKVTEAPKVSLIHSKQNEDILRNVEFVPRAGGLALSVVVGNEKAGTYEGYAFDANKALVAAIEIVVGEPPEAKGEAE